MKRSIMLVFAVLAVTLCLGILAACNNSGSISSDTTNNNENNSGKSENDNSNKSAYEMYQKSVMAQSNEGRNYKSIELGYDMKIVDTKAGGTQELATIAGTTKKVFKDTAIENDYDMEMTLKVTVPDTNVPIETKSYYTNGCTYSIANGMKVSVPLGPENAARTSRTNPLIFDESMIKESKVDQKGDLTVLSFKIDSKLFENEGVLSPDSKDFLEHQPGDQTFSDIDFMITVDKDNRMQESKMVYSVTSGEKTTSFETIVKALSYDKITGIDFPSDLDSYMSVPG